MQENGGKNHILEVLDVTVIVPQIYELVQSRLALWSEVIQLLRSERLPNRDKENDDD